MVWQEPRREGPELQIQYYTEEKKWSGIHDAEKKLLELRPHPIEKKQRVDEGQRRKGRSIYLEIAF